MATPSFSQGSIELPTMGPTDWVELDNGSGMRARLLGLGATLTSLEVPSADGAGQEVVLGFEDPAQYCVAHPFFGSTVGRFANRIAHGRFTLDGETHTLEQNDGAHHLHGGSNGFHHCVFSALPFANEREAGVMFSRVSPHGESGYPGRLEVDVRYRLSTAGVLRIELVAQSDRPTIANLTHHSYFNLHDGGQSAVLDHVLWIPTERALEIDPAGIPTGALLDVRGTALDFTTARAIGERVDQLPQRGGYDHCYVLGENVAHELRFAARLSDPSSGRTLEVWTTQPALQLYSGNRLDGTLVGHAGVRYRARSGVCLETQHCPDAPNHPAFEATRIDPGRPYMHAVEYRFGTR